MKICIPASDSNGIESILSNHFGSAPFFIMYNSDDKSVATAVNGDSKHMHGKCMPVDFLMANNIEYVLCKGIGARAASLLNDSGIKVFLVNAQTVGEAITDFESGALESLDSENACKHHSCH